MKKKTAIPHRLHANQMPGKKSHGEVDVLGQIMISPPIAVLPKPLARSYRNFYSHYESYRFDTHPKLVEKDRKKQTTLEYYPPALFGSALVSNLLRHYFPGPDYKVKKVTPGSGTDEDFVEEAFVTGVPVKGTKHWIVRRKQEPKHEIVPVVVLVTDELFLQLPARKNPTVLRVEKELQELERLAGLIQG